MIVSSTDVCLRRGAKNYNALAFSVSHARLIDTTHLDEHGLRSSGKAASDERAAQRPRDSRMARCSGQAVARAARSRALAQLPPLTPRPTESPSFMSSSSFAIIHVIIRPHYVLPASSGAWAANLGKAASDERAAQYPRESRMARCSG